MRNYDPYKRTILFFASIINIVMMTAVFAYGWYHYYADTMYVFSFYRRGHYVVLALYGVMLLFFSNMYGSLRIGQYRRIEVLLSQYLSLLVTNVLFYFIISLLAFGFVKPWVMLLVMAGEMIVSSLFNVIIIHLYNRIFQPWKLLLIYGERSAVDLIYKVETRRDKYAIYDAINIEEGMELIIDKIDDFQAVIIGDISAVERNDLLKYCYAHHKRAYVVPKLSDLILMGSDRIHVFDTPFLLSKGYALSFDERFLKRMLDLCIAIPLTIIALPFMLLTALAVKLSDGGPVLYRQVRCTQNDREFQILKFRSMVVGAEKDGVAKLASENDERVTKVGRFIRATRLDELPQLFNILRGDMSFVGPRPERPEIIEQYTVEMPEFRFRTRVKAGLTGYAQVYGKYNTTPYDKLKLDLFYIENYTLWQDVKLLLMTMKTMLKREATQGIDEGTTTAWKEREDADVFDTRRVLAEISEKEEDEWHE
ncbi:MAG: sugar transferase [Lachnospiraceae bacterium]|nr:sugar transferase [Lachnospiraceae bacterium]